MRPQSNKLGAPLNESPDPQFTQVKLTGPPGHVAALVSRLGQESRILFDTSSGPDVRGDISRRVEMVADPVPRAGEQGARTSVTVQVVLDIDHGVWLRPGTVDTELRDAVSSALEEVRGVLRADTRVVAVNAFRSPEE